MKILFALLYLGLALAPWPRGIALNQQTKECGSYWAGDEYGHSALPEGWEDYYPGNDGIINTAVGSCSYVSSDTAGGAENCCSELGYEYIGRVGDFGFSPLMWFSAAYYVCPAAVVCCCVGLAVVLFLLVALLLVSRKRKPRRPADEDT